MRNCFSFFVFCVKKFCVLREKLHHRDEDHRQPRRKRGEDRQILKNLQRHQGERDRRRLCGHRQGHRRHAGAHPGETGEGDGRGVN